MPPIVLDGERLQRYRTALNEAFDITFAARTIARFGLNVAITAVTIENLRSAAAQLQEAADILETNDDKEP